MKHSSTKTPRFGRIRRSIRAPRTVVVALVAAGLGAIIFGGVSASAASSTDAQALFHREAVIRTNADNSLKATDTANQNTNLRRDLSVLAQAKTFATPTVTSLDVAGTTLQHIGGSWGAGHTVLGSKALTPGTYLIALTGDFYRAGTPGVCQDLAATPVGQIQVNIPGVTQVTAMTGAFPSDPAETCGLGSDGTPNGLEQIASAYTTIKVTAPVTAELDAFGYNPDRGSEGSGAIGVISHLTVTQLGG